MNYLLKTKKISVLLLVVILFCVTLTAIGCQSQSEEASGEITKLRFGSTPGEDIKQMEARYEPLVEYLSRELDMEVELFIGTDYTATVEAMRAGNLDVAMFGPFSYVLANDLAGAEAFAIAYDEKMGIYYESYIITHPDSSIEEISDLKGKTFAYVDPASTGGYLIPRMHMVEAGIDPDKDLASSVFLGGHDACAFAVKNKEVDAATIVKGQYDFLMEKGEISEENVKIIHTSDKFPGGPLAYRKDLPEELKTKIKDLIVNMPQEEIDNMKGILFRGDVTKYVEANDEDWNIIRKCAEVLDLDLEEMK